MLAAFRNLGKAFYENPVTHAQAIEVFKKAFDLAPDSARERINYGLALLRGGKTKEGAAELEKAQRQDPSIPHTWFNLGIVYKKDGDNARAIAQFEQMVKLVPDEPSSHYNLGYLYKLTGKAEPAVKQFEEAERLDPNLGAPHFQLYNAYRQLGRAADSDRESKLFQEIKKRQAGAAVPEDLDWSFYAEIYEPFEPHPPMATGEPAAQPQFSAKKLASGVDPKTAGMIVLDFNGDGRPDLLVWSAAGIWLYRSGSTPVENSGLTGLRGVVSVTAGDFNNDGFTDLCVITDSGARLYENQKGVFHELAARLPEGKYVKAVWLDYDHDYDLDLILLGERSALVRNNGAAGFSDMTAEFPFASGHVTAAVAIDVVPWENGADVAVAYADHAGVLYRDKLGGKYEAHPLTAVLPGARTLVSRDVDNDGWTDLVASYGESAVVIRNREGTFEAGAPLPTPGRAIAFADFDNRGLTELVIGGAIHQNKGLGQFSAAKSLAGDAGIQAVVAADFDQDGKSDLAAILADGSVQLLRNETPTGNGWLGVTLNGVRNLKLAAGARVEVKAGSVYEKQTYEGIPLTFAMASQAQADTVRITWPNGLIQNEIQQPQGKLRAYKEAQRLSGSCPMIFTWNGQTFEFITDVLGVAPLGASLGDGRYFPVDHDEYVQIPGSSLAPIDGHYEVRITEELREVSYLDEVHLIAVDHPRNIEVYTNDKFKSPPFPEFRLFGVRRRIYPKSARDNDGRDVLPRLIKRDATYPDRFHRDYNGVAALHHLDLDFGKASPDNRAILILNGWLDWADGSTYRRASQESKQGLILPYLQVKDASGAWRTVIEDMGVPAGKSKTITVDLTGRFLSASREVRIVTNLALYWDEIFLGEDPESPEVVLTDLEPTTAQLGFHGFSTSSVHPARMQPERFDYQNEMGQSMWNPTPGKYTRYGNVRPLVRSIDDMLVIMGSGDELKLEFPAKNLPTVRSGWQRDFLLLVDGWAKDQDANTAFGQSVEPLPFHSMSRYPYPASEHFPSDQAHRQYREEYNTRPALRLLRPLREPYQAARARPQ
jgi:tetratricopeptide (TPR) repeat protein